MIRIIFFIATMLSFITVKGQDRYTNKGGDPNGINKWYMGRQIAYVMSHYGIGWLERPEREMEENTSLLMQNLNLKQGMNIADVGARPRRAPATAGASANPVESGKRSWSPAAGQNYRGNPDKIQDRQMYNRVGNKD